jgi:hypothetical protein
LTLDTPPSSTASVNPGLPPSTASPPAFCCKARWPAISPISPSIRLVT